MRHHPLDVAWTAITLAAAAAGMVLPNVAGCEARGRVAWSDPTRFRDADLIAYYNLDEVAGDRVRDGSGRNHHGVARGRLAFVPGRFSNGVRLDGGSWIEIPAAADLELFDSFTLAAWVKPDRLDGLAGLVARADDGWRSYYLGLAGESAEIGWDGVQTEVAVRGGVFPAAGEWVHVAATVDEILNTRLYLDGQLVATARAPFSPSRTGSPVPLVLGRLGGLGGPALYHGVLDEVRVYSKALSDDDIRELAGRWSNEPPEMVTVASSKPAVQAVGQPVTFSASAVDPDGDPITYSWLLDGGARYSRVGSGDLVHVFSQAGTFVAWASITDGFHPEIRANPVTVHVGTAPPNPAVAYGLIADWPVDDQDAPGKLEDHTGHGHTATLGAGAMIFDLDEHRRPVVLFDDGAAGAGVAPATDLGLGGDITIAGWIKPARLGPYGVVRQAGTTSDPASDPGDGLSLGVGTDRLEISVGPAGATRFSAGHVEVQLWNHVAVTVEAEAQRVTLYFGGRLVGVARWPAAATTGHPGRHLEIGGPIRTGAGEPYAGKMDDLRIYGYALSAVEVRALAIPGPVR
jgi:hypothetical protein